MEQPVVPPVDLNNQAIVQEDGSRISRISADDLEENSGNLKTTFDGFKRGLDLSNNGPCLGTRTGNSYEWQSYQQVYDRAQAFGSGLIADGLKANNDTFIGIYSMNRAEWSITDVACNMFSMISVPLYDTLGPQAVLYIINEVEISHVVCDNNDKAKHLLEIAEKIPSLACIIVMENVSDETKLLACKTEIKVTNFTDIEATGKSSLYDPVPPQPDDIMTLCYTSGTTGNPKGALISHKNMIVNMTTITYNIKKVTQFYPADRHLSYLPLAHLLERGVQTVMFMHGCQIGFFSGDIKQLSDDLQCLKPHIFPSVPRLLNRIYDKVLAATQSSSLKKIMFTFALSQKSKDLKRGIIRNNSIWDYLVFGKVQQLLGGNVRMILTGSAPLEAKVMDFFRCAFGCLVLEGYGQTEATAGITFTVPGDFSTGHVGSPLPGLKVKVVDVPEMGYFAKDEKGEICCQGQSVFRGYFKNKEKTHETIDEDGWLHTGDIGVWLPNGTLKIIDRKKNIFKLAQGEYIAPEKIEIAYMRSQYIAQVFVDGNSLKPCIMGVVVPDEETVKKLSTEAGVSGDMSSICKSEKIKDIILKDMLAVGKGLGLKSFEQVKDILLYPELFSVENNLMTTTFKNKRFQLRQFFKREVDNMYEKHNI